MTDSWRAAAFPLRLKCVHPWRCYEPAKMSRYNAQLSYSDLGSEKLMWIMVADACRALRKAHIQAARQSSGRVSLRQHPCAIVHTTRSDLRRRPRPIDRKSVV